MPIGDPPRTVGDLMAPVTRVIEPSTTVGAAIDAMREQHQPGLAVVEAGHLVGFVIPMQLLGQPTYRLIAEVMVKDPATATPDLALHRAHELLTRQHADVLPVTEGRRVVGLITLAAVLEARSQDRDPLTGLPWPGALRAWAMAALERGQEVAALFVDLDNFGIVNKALGHVVGDGILRSVSSLLAGLIDPSTDFLCRYGGDEFAVATTRRGDEAGLLAHRIRETVSVPIEIEGISERVTASVGFAGGRRVERRTSSHIASTMDDLLTLASRGSTLAKESGRGITLHGWREKGRIPHLRPR
jgi:diguanylate cyclase (GGDEF)-like protein